MKEFMVVAHFKPGTNMADVMAVVGEEQQRVAELQSGGSLGAVHLATAARQTVFLEVSADSDDEAADTVRTLPMAQWWDLDIYPLNPPAHV